MGKTVQYFQTVYHHDAVNNTRGGIRIMVSCGVGYQSPGQEQLSHYTFIIWPGRLGNVHGSGQTT